MRGGRGGGSVMNVPCFLFLVSRLLSWVGKKVVSLAEKKKVEWNGSRARPGRQVGIYIYKYLSSWQIEAPFFPLPKASGQTRRGGGGNVKRKKKS
jgi:hypothetical protein